MAKFTLHLFAFTLNIIVIYAAISAFDDILDNVTSCEDNCTKSYSAHTYPNGSENSACSRGCRLFTITQFITADEPTHTNTIDDNGSSPAKVLCHHSCAEAYNETSSMTDACKMGCNFEESASTKKEKTEEETGPSIHLLKPLMEIREVTSKVVGMLRIVQSSLTTYFMRDDNSVVAVEGPVHVMVQLNPNVGKLEENEIFDSSSQQTLHQPVLKEKIGDAYANGKSRIDYVSRRLSCLMVISLIIFIILFTYILVITCFKKPKNQKQNMLSSNTIPAHAMPVKLVRPEDLTKLSLMDEDETHAPGLHTNKGNIKLPDNTAI